MPLIWLGSIGEAVRGGADALGRVLETGANTVGECVADLIESAGSGIRDLLAPTAGLPVLGLVITWMGAVVSGAADLTAVAVKSASDVSSGLLAGSLRVIGGLLSADCAFTKRGGLDVASGVGGGLLLAVAAGLSFLQAVIPSVQPLGRRLTAAEGRRLKQVFGGSLPCYNIRLLEGSAGLFSVNDRPFTLGNKVYLKERDISVERSLLVHECVHAWQYQHAGARYAVQALGAQWTTEDAYDWEAEIARGRREWTHFNREAQAEFIQDLYDRGALVDATGATIWSGGGAFFAADNHESFGRFHWAGVDYTDLADQAVQVIRSTASSRLSGMWS